MVIVAVIQQNECEFTEMAQYAEPLLYTKLGDSVRKEMKQELNNYLWDVMGKFVTLVDIPIEFLIEHILNYTTNKFPGKDVGSDFLHITDISYAMPKKYLEIIHSKPQWPDFPKLENVNSIASLFSIEHRYAEHTAVIIANSYDTSQPKSVKLTDITKKDLLAVIRRRFLHTAVMISENSLHKYYYQDLSVLLSSALDISLDEEGTVQKLYFENINYGLTMYWNPNNTTKKINKIATRINGCYRVNGDVLLTNEMGENIPANLSIREVKRLNVLSYGRLCDRQLSPFEIRKEEKITVNDQGKEEKKEVITPWNKYLVMDERMKKWKGIKCIYCGIIAEKKLKCNLCYRAVYCSLECWKKYSAHHREECMNIAGNK